MAAGTQSQRDADTRADSLEPSVSVCESCPGRSVFIEADNTDGWLASDTVVDVVR